MCAWLHPYSMSKQSGRATTGTRDQAVGGGCGCGGCARESWVGDFHVWGLGIRPNPSKSDPRPNPSESGIHFCRAEMPIQTVKYCLKG